MKRFFFLFIGYIIAVSVFADTYVVCVGINNYADPKMQSLIRTETDAKAMAEFYKKGSKNVIIITGKYATKDRILKSLISQFSRSKTNDKIVFFFSGHGYPEGFCPYDMTKPEEGIKFSVIINIMLQSKASSKFIFADACHSGAIRNNFSKPIKDSNNILFFLSSRGNEFSAESPFLANGFFTKYLLRGLAGAADKNHDKRITACELFNFVSDGVKSKTNGSQHPVMWGKFDNSLTIVEYRNK